MILTARAILTAIKMGELNISPFDEKQLNPNSYDVRLGPKILTYDEVELDCAKKPRTLELDIPPSGLLLQPGTLYLGATIERTWSDQYVAMIEGRSSIGRLGLFVHVTAGFGDLGFSGRWTLELMTVHPIRVYYGMKIAQIYFHVAHGPHTLAYAGKYQNAGEVQASRLWTEFESNNPDSRFTA